MISVFVLIVIHSVSRYESIHARTISFMHSTSISSPLCLGSAPLRFSSDTFMMISVFAAAADGLAHELDDSESILPICWLNKKSYLSFSTDLSPCTMQSTTVQNVAR